MIISVNVTAEDIDKGMAKCGGSCPVAHASRRAFKGMSLSVGKSQLFVYTSKGCHVIRLPKKVQTFIDNFDLGGKNSKECQPFTFTVRCRKSLV